MSLSGNPGNRELPPTTTTLLYRVYGQRPASKGYVTHCECTCKMGKRRGEGEREREGGRGEEKKESLKMEKGERQRESERGRSEMKREWDWEKGVDRLSIGQKIMIAGSRDRRVGSERRERGKQR